MPFRDRRACSHAAHSSRIAGFLQPAALHSRALARPGRSPLTDADGQWLSLLSPAQLPPPLASSTHARRKSESIFIKTVTRLLLSYL